MLRCSRRYEAVGIFSGGSHSTSEMLVPSSRNRAPVLHEHDGSRPLRANDQGHGAAVDHLRGSKPPSSPVIGIDLGSSYARVGIYNDNHQRVDILPSLTPTYVAWDATGEVLVGEDAMNQAAINPKNVLFDFKRLLGRSYTSVQAECKRLPYKVVSSSDDKPLLQVTVMGDKRQFSPEEVTAVVLTQLKQIAEAHLGREVFDAVVAVHVYFSADQQQATQDACTLAGLTVERMVYEPIDAAIAYADNRNAVGDTNSATRNENFTQNLVNYFVTNWKYRRKVDIRKDKHALQRLRQEAERVKLALSNGTAVRLELETLIDGQNIKDTLIRMKFEEINASLLKKTLDHVRRVLKDSGLKKWEVHEIVVVGGSSRIPKIQQLVDDYFNGKTPIYVGRDPNTTIASGAAWQAIRGERDGTRKNVPPLLGSETVDGATGLPRQDKSQHTDQPPQVEVIYSVDTNDHLYPIWTTDVGGSFLIEYYLSSWRPWSISPSAI